MKMIPEILKRVVIAAIVACGRCSAAEPVPPAKESAPLLVGDYGRKEALVIEGNGSFTKDQILSGMTFDLDYHLAAHPDAPLADYLTVLERKISLGYQRAGFPTAKVKVAADTNQHRVVVRVKEGPRYRCGEILLSGVPTMTNEVVRQAIARVIGGLEARGGTSTNLNESFWLRNQLAPFDEVARQSLVRMVQEALTSLNHYQPKVSVRIVPDAARKVADLQVDIADEGIKGIVTEIAVEGLRTNTRPQLLEYLKLKPGMEVNAQLTTAASNQLWRSARFFRQEVSLTPLPTPGQFKLMLDLDEVREAPALNQAFSPKESALLKFRDWLADWETRPEDFLLSVGLPDALLHGRVEFVLSPSGFAMAMRDGPANSPSKLRYAIVTSEKLIGLYSVWRRSKFTMPRTKNVGGVRLQIRPPSPKSYGQGNVTLAMGLGNAQSQPFLLELEMQPAVFLSMAHWMDSSLKDGVLTLNQREDGVVQEMRLDAATGRLLQFTASSGESNAMSFQLRAEEGSLARLLKEIAAVTAGHANSYVTNHGFSSGASFVARDVIESPMIERVLDYLDPETVASDPRNGAATPPRRIKSALALVGEILGQQNLDAVFDPLDRIWGGTPGGEDQEGFVVPADASPSDVPVNPMRAISAWVVSFADGLLPRGSWPWVLLRESAFTVAGQAKYTDVELAKLRQSEEVGPVGSLAIATLLGRIQPKLARAFAERGLARLTPSEFRRDYRLLLRTNSIVGDLAGNALGLLGGVSEARLTPLVAGLAPEEAAWLLQLARLLRDGQGQPVGEAAWPAFEQHWDKVPRRYLEMGLNRFLPQVQFLTNGQALYERGLRVSSMAGMLQDVDEASQCFRKAAELGHAGAQLQLGGLYESGRGVGADPVEAMRWYRKASAQHEPHANCSIAALHQDGKGVAQDLDEAARLFRLEAEANCARAQFDLGRILETKLDSEAALQWYRRAAEQGLPAAQARAGDLLSDGLFVTADLVESCQWLSLAAAAGDKLSEIRLRRLKAKLTNEQLGEVEKRVTAATRRLDEIKKARETSAAKRKK